MSDLDKWLDELGLDPSTDNLRTACVTLAGMIRAMPDTEYRHLAECKLADTIAIAYVAARQ